MRVRPDPFAVQRAARLLVEAKAPLMIVGDEVTRTKSVAKAVKLAEKFGWLSRDEKGLKRHRERQEFEAKLRTLNITIPWK